MRTGPLIVFFGLACLALSGCASLEKVAAVAAANDINDTATSGTLDTGGTGNADGTSQGQSNTEGGTAFVFNDGFFNIDGNSKALITVTNAGAGINNETANVQVNTGLSGMTWADAVEMALFRTTVSGLPTDGLSFMPDYYTAAVVNPNFTGYKEYRKITSTSDVELQVWSFTNSSIGQYFVHNDPSASNNDNVALFFDGNATPTSALPGGTATYNGKFGGTAVTSNWLTQTRTVADPFDTGSSGAGTTYDPNGTWRVVGDVQVTADFAAGTVNGTISNTTWRKFTGDSPNYITVTPAETAKPFHNYTFNATITENTYKGNVQGPAGVVVNGNNSVAGGFFGPNAEETAGVLASDTTSAGPSDGITANDDNRRGYIKLRGVFQGNR